MRPLQAAIVWVAVVLCTVSADSLWEPVGIGGGGAFFDPAISPHDGKLMFVSSDMGGFYRSVDGGQRWAMLDWRQIQRSHAPVFHPAEPKQVYALAFGGRTLRLSRDAGVTWEVSGGPLWAKDTLRCLAISPALPACLLIGGDQGVYRSLTAGRSWELLPDAPRGIRCLYAVSGRDLVFVGASEDAIHRTSDGGQTWHQSNQGLPWTEIRDFGGGTDPKTDRTLLYCTIPSREVKGRFAGGVYRSADLGKTWEPAMGRGINTTLGRQDRYGIETMDQYASLKVAAQQPGTLYVTNRGTGYEPPYHYTVFRSDDGGRNWRHCMFSDPRFEANNTAVGWLFYDRSRGYGGVALGLAVNPAEPDQALVTNYGEVFATVDGGRGWRQVYSRRVDRGTPGKQQRWTTVGLEDTSCWGYVVDPRSPTNAYICYTDIGLARSDDSGQSWRSAVIGIPWRNTVYQLVCDPDVPGRLYAACSTQHDIPHWASAQGPRGKGGVCRSSDNGKTWEPLPGLPEAPVTCLLLEADSPVRRRTLYAGVYGHGIFRSLDGGAHWESRSAGLAPTANRQVYVLRQSRTGALFCSVLGRRQGKGAETPLSGGLFRSNDGGESWTRLSSPEIFRPVDFFLHPEDEDTIYLAAMDGLGHTGGLYRTRDGGKTWQLLPVAYDRAQCPYIEGVSVAIDPADTRVLYFLTNSHGMFRSRDAGESWHPIPAGESPPFMNCMRLQWIGKDAATAVVTTFGGGVWRAPATVLRGE